MFIYSLSLCPIKRVLVVIAKLPNAELELGISQ